MGDIKQLTQEIAAFLGPDWKADSAQPSTTHSPWTYESPQDGYIQGQGAERIHLRLVDKKRLTVWGQYPATAKGEHVALSREDEASRPSISIAVSRGPEAIAKDIVRRFLPAYRRILALVGAEKQNRDAYDRAQDSNLEKLAAALDHNLTERERSEQHFHLGHLPKYFGLYGEASVTNTSAELRLRSVPIDIAIQIAQLITKKD